MNEDSQVSKGRRLEDRLVLNERLQIATAAQKEPLYRNRLKDDQKRRKHEYGNNRISPWKRDLLIFFHNLRIDFVARRIKRSEAKLKRLGKSMAADYNTRLRHIAAKVGLETEGTL